MFELEESDGELTTAQRAQKYKRLKAKLEGLDSLSGVSESESPMATPAVTSASQARPAYKDSKSKPKPGTLSHYSGNDSDSSIENFSFSMAIGAGHTVTSTRPVKLRKVKLDPKSSSAKSSYRQTDSGHAQKTSIKKPELTTASDSDVEILGDEVTEVTHSSHSREPKGKGQEMGVTGFEGQYSIPILQF